MATIPVTPPAHHVQNINIVSASAITKKIDQCLAILYPDSTSAPTPTSTDDLPAVSISARSATASKAITIAEILKRHIGEQGGQWYQYTLLSSVDVVEKEKSQQLSGKKSAQRKQNYKKRKQEGNKVNEMEDVEEGEGIEEDPYTVMEGKVPPKRRKVPLLTIYISRSPMPGFKKLYGEQSGGP